MNRNDRVLITGGTGFIGGRLVERLAAQGVPMRIATSDFRHCSRVARFPVELVKADLRDHTSLAKAVAGCNVIVHCSYRFGGSTKEQRKINLDGTRVLAEALLTNGGRRFIHISSVSAYGSPEDGDLSEDSPPRLTKDAYSQTKLEIEQLLHGLHHTRGLPVVVLQPTIVYGPYGATWTTGLLEQVRLARIVLPANGQGLCNAVYVDDVVSAVELAAERDAPLGERFLISGPAPITWREFYGAYEKMLAKSAVLFLDDEQIRIEERRQQKLSSLPSQLYRWLARRKVVRERLLGLPPQSWLIAAGQQLLPRSARVALAHHYEAFWQFPPDPIPPLYVPNAEVRKLYAAKTRVRIDKARKMLGFRPAFDIDKGISLTTEWARWANLLNH